MELFSQEHFDMISNEWKKDRAKTQMTLGGLINRLKQLDKGVLINNFCNPHSYRGYYVDLSFEPVGGSRNVTDVLKDVESCLNKTFEGYKSGEYLMDENTPIWVSFKGNWRDELRLIDIADDGELIVAKEED